MVRLYVLLSFIGLFAFIGTVALAATRLDAPCGGCAFALGGLVVAAGVGSRRAVERVKGRAIAAAAVSLTAVVVDEWQLNGLGFAVLNALGAAAAFAYPTVAEWGAGTNKSPRFGGNGYDLLGGWVPGRPFGRPPPPPPSASNYRQTSRQA